MTGAPPDFGQQTFGYEPTGWRAWVVPVLGGLAFGAILAVIVGLI